MAEEETRAKFLEVHAQHRTAKEEMKKLEELRLV
jgi:hypothetical protein